ncbi:hypothetical protein [Massilia pseudoviolaceinigra]|uniref:hypothetical protein n=1 Tax=Massilia pseudoviolaceinigra TaxID=3057165 RepID=UPI002796AF81|nr:hypothetical protein [Massilia sp. CCM 9206]MDQ1920912.1 hypothetical protein [Massilia sp. CCM 9206]
MENSIRQDIWVISCYSNPLGYRTRRQNFERFAASIVRQGGNLLVLEKAEVDSQFDLDEQAYNCVRLRGDGLIWQKERMLNLALRHLPPECRKVVWADGDILFEAPNWLALTSDALEHDIVVQPFDRSVRLPYGHLEYRGESQENSGVTESFASCYQRDAALSRNEIYANHGHTGYAWAARRDFLETCGLYDVCITGSGDHLMAHAFAGALSSPCIAKMIGEGHAFARHFARWAQKADGICQGRLGFVPGTVLHLWHGSLANRRYFVRNQEVKELDFDPERDMRLDANGLWTWADSAGHLREWSAAFFKSRHEDDVEEAAAA